MSDSVKRYTSEGIDVTFDTQRCIHAAECVRGLPGVFDTQRRPWVQPANAAADVIAEVVLRCPSGALHFERKDGGAEESPAAQNIVHVRAAGPLHVRGSVRLVTQEGELVLLDTRLAQCRCGQSQNKPFCDNSHREAGFADPGHVTPNEVKLETTAGELVVKLRQNGSLKVDGPFTLVGADGAAHRGTETALCRCGGSGNKPFCDGTHRRIDFQA
jgi:CDGSH-type Zn-finger protein/uncharacterized Fe-S cluster protein YjdI